MAAINFPTTPSVNDIHTVNGRSWQWDGYSWLAAGSTAMANTILSLPTTTLTASGPQTAAFVAGESITAGDLCFLKTGGAGVVGKWFLVDADLATTTDGLLGISLQTKSVDAAMTVALPGSFVMNSGWSWANANLTLYVSNTAGGIVATTQPSGTDDAVRVVGWSVDATKIYFAPSALYFTHT